MAGYSGTPLIKKLGLKPEMKIRLIAAPPAYFEWLEADVSSQLCPAGSIPDWVHLFAASLRDFEREMKSLAPIWRKNRTVVIWISWYKKSSGRATDLTEDVVRDYALANGLVDIKVCAVSE
ncbi:MAG TPA: hypothetical protein VNU70_09865, partial [Puia sp.]|nr:hypothetical protein [Puia sp.]